MFRNDSSSPSSPLRRPSLMRGPRWLRIAAEISAGLSALLILLVLVAIVLLNNASFHRYLIGVLEREAGDSLGVRLQLQEFGLHLSHLSLDLYGVTVDGAAPYQNPPILQVEHVEAGVRISSILRRKWYFERIQVDNPVIQVFVDKNGVSNIPKIKSSGQTRSNNTTIFDLGIRHALLNHAALFYNSRPATLSADVRDLNFQAAFNSLEQKYSGTLAYQGGHVQYGGYEPFTHDLQANFDATPSTFHLTSATLASGQTSLKLAATVNNYANPSVQGQYDAAIDGDQMGALLHASSVPSGMVHASGTLAYQSTPGRTALDSLQANGTLSSSGLLVKASSTRVRVTGLLAHYGLANGTVTLNDLRAGLLNGELTAQGALHDLSGNTHSNMTASLHDVSLAQLQQALGRSGDRAQVVLSGSVNAKADAAWGKTFSDLVAHADTEINGQVAPSRATAHIQVVASNAAPPPTAFAVNGHIAATYTGAGQLLTVRDSYIRTPHTNLTLNGTAGEHSSLAVRLNADDLREVAAIARAFEPPANPPAPALDLAGQASFNGNVTGALSAPHLTGRLSTQGLHFNGSDWKVLRAGVDLSPWHAALVHADLEPAQRGRITLDASAALHHWSFSKSSPIALSLNASEIDAAEIMRLAGQTLPVTGTLNADVKLHGSVLNPEGSGSVALTKGNAYDQPIQSVRVNFSGTGDNARADLAVALAAGSINGTVNVQPRQKTYTAQISSNGIDLKKLQLLEAHNVDATGTVSISAKGQGSFDNPQLTASVQIPKLIVQGQAASDINLQMNLANHVANATLASSVANTSIQAKATVQTTGGYMADATLDTKGIPLQPILAVYAPAQAPNISGQTELHATVHGPLKNRNELEAHLTIPVLQVNYSNTVQLAAASPLHIDYQQGVIHVQPGSIRGTDTDLSFQGTIPTTGNGPMALRLQGNVNLQLAQLFDSDIRSSGALKFNVNSNGAVNAAQIGGDIQIVDANFASATLPVGLQHANGALTLTRDRVNISRFQGTIGGGTVTASGGVAYRGGIQFDLGLAAQGVRVLYPQGMRETADAHLRLTGTTENALLAGSVNLGDLSFTPAFDLGSFVSQVSGGVASPPSQGFSQNVALNIAVHSTNNVNLVSRTLSVGGSANLQVRGTASDPVLLGRVNLTGGDIILNGNRFLLTGGTIQFINPSETQPVVNLTISTTIQEYKISMRFRGPASQLHTQYTSDPALPQADIINLLAFGQTTEAAANSPTTANQAAESLVASQVSSQVTSRVSKIAGISQLSINPVLAGSSSEGPPGANITIQQRVTGNLFVTFSTNVASTQSQTIQGQYQVSPRVAVSATRDPNGGFAFDTLIKKSW